MLSEAADPLTNRALGTLCLMVAGAGFVVWAFTRHENPTLIDTISMMILTFAPLVVVALLENRHCNRGARGVFALREGAERRRPLGFHTPYQSAGFGKQYRDADRSGRWTDARGE
jgi:hypothetical protein